MRSYWIGQLRAVGSPGRLAVLSGHSAPVTSLAVHRLPSGPADSTTAGASGDVDDTGVAGTTPNAGPGPRLLVVSTAGDSDVIVWRCGPAESGSGREGATTAALTHLPLEPEWTLLATGGTDRKVHLHVRPPGPTGRFAPACVLEGHENWVRGVAFCHVAAAAAAGEGAGGGGGEAAATELLLASVYGRIWRLTPQPLAQEADAPAAAAAAAPAAGAPPAGVDHEDPLARLIRRYAPKPHVDSHRTRYVATSEALLIGHEDWVHGLQWAPPPPPAAAAEGDGAASGGGPAAAARGLHTRTSAALLTASMDRTMVIWHYEPSSGLWMNEASLGDAGASCLGYFGGVWGPGGSAILAHGFTGALHLWRRPPAPTPAPAPLGSGPWLPSHALGGHFGPVVDLGWGLDGGCVLSVSEDQTARVHAGAVWRRGGGGGSGGDGGAEEGERERLHWCEIARSQIHGHDFRCLAMLATPPGSNFAYVSGAEEKVLRVLEAPQAFVDTLVALRGGEASAQGRALLAEGRRGHGFGAAVAALGLSNKAVFEDDAAAVGGGGGNAGVGSGMPGGDYADGPDFVPCAAPQVVREPPLEEHLAQNTLWPEAHKLYGHGNDVFAAAASPDGSLVASACKAQTASTAAIWVWCARTWRPLAQLRAHTLTVTQLEWSPTGALLAAASRDRTFSIFRRRDPPTAEAVPAAAGGAAGDEAAFELVCRTKAAHGRVIWSVSWSLDERLLATASRDETVKVWRLPGGGGDTAAGAAPVLAATLPQFPCAATAVAFAPTPATNAAAAGGGEYLLAVGLENGAVQLWKLTEAGPAADGSAGGGGPALAATRLWEAADAWCHAAAVRRLRWRGAPGTGGQPLPAAPAQDGGRGGAAALQLASGSDDHSVRVFTFRRPS
ncbi:hypothetical protein GPECTOR_77g12 [Gonium pectorale]|uniref:Elongator complex protein 2 n=1 Tax=Gonium pectorale TaxID=33097 RepID=A0A150G327_GONPE|nr:hypothetical protein GPECTOR_77g12 [Gonium pectorale]|eukprot:KXZ43915.1 hypothetical protein GPECTOR_77g12 [Gonium pectorale]